MIAASEESSLSAPEEFPNLNASLLSHTAYDFFLSTHLLIYARPFGPQRSRPHTAEDAGDVDVAGAEHGVFLGNLGIFVSRAG